MGSVVKPQRFKCGGWTECEHDHDFYAPEDVVILSLAVSYEEFRDCDSHWTQEKEDRARADKTLHFAKAGVAPTALGLWFEDASLN